MSTLANGVGGEVAAILDVPADGPTPRKVDQQVVHGEIISASIGAQEPSLKQGCVGPHDRAATVAKGLCSGLRSVALLRSRGSPPVW